MSRPRVALSIAGSDPSAGAGIQADLKVFSCYEVYGLTCVTCITAQSSSEVTAIWPVGAARLGEQLRLATKALWPDAIKIGALCSAAQIRAVARFVDEWPEAHVVLDPVLRSSAGAPFSGAEALVDLAQRLLPRVSLVTPNHQEAAALDRATGGLVTASPRARAEALAERFGCRVLLTGGDVGAPGRAGRGRQAQPGSVEDVLVHEGGVKSFSSPRSPGPSLHGSGCILSAAIAAELARRPAAGVEAAVTRGLEFMTRVFQSTIAPTTGAAGDQRLAHLAVVTARL